MNREPKELVVPVMPTRKPQAIAGVSAGYEALMEDLYPSLARTSWGRWLHGCYESLPFAWGPLRWSHVLYIPPTLPLLVFLYFWMKVFGPRYVVSNRALKQFRGVTRRLLLETKLEEIDDVVIDEASRLPLYRTATLQIRGTDGQVLQTLPGVPYPARFREVILTAAEARRQVESALATIQRRRTPT
jgi:hypothetical protein